MKVYLSKQGFLLSYCEIILSQMYIRLPLIANSNSQKNTAFFFLFRLKHQTACLGILHSQTLLMKSLCNCYSQREVD